MGHPENYCWPAAAGRPDAGRTDSHCQLGTAPLARDVGPDLRGYLPGPAWLNLLRTHRVARLWPAPEAMRLAEL
jgi:hypothetical protein